ncbi:MAG: hypothetical protein PHV11_09690 [Candidatus Bipolaricaulis sp.]|nr:hypothetical protein [Candidatus Bipolaricaulis sp.]MDD5645676.1 hypothetical protein [Candidatus Bipolaricaulis sp.]
MRSESPREYVVVRRDGMALEHVPDDRAFVAAAFDGLVNAAALLADYFGLHGRFPAVRTILVPDRAEFDRCVAEVLQIQIEVPSHPARIALPQGTNLVLLSPRAYDPGRHRHTPEGFERLIGHELTHIVEEHLSPNIEAVPRWWSEGLAMHLSGDWLGELPHVKGETAGGLIPALAEMQDGAVTDVSVRLCYQWGWTVVRYIESIHGRAGIRRIVEQCADGDVLVTLGAEPAPFEREWRNWLIGFCSARPEDGLWAKPR